jgi:hypothetical protein
MYDIKDIQPAKSGIGDWWKSFTTLIIGIGAAIYWYIKNTKKKIEAEVYKTPIEQLAYSIRWNKRTLAKRRS